MGRGIRMEKDAVKEGAAEEAGSDDQANNQATASRAAGQSIAMTGNTFSVTNNFGTGNDDDRKRRTDEHDAGPSHKKKANDKTMSMTTRHRTILEKSAPDILNDLKADDVLPLLLRDRVITTDDADEVKTKPTRREKVAALLDILPRRGDKAYASFLDSLNDTQGSAHLHESVKECEEVYDQEQDVPTSQGAERLTSSNQPSRGGNTQSGGITISASGSATIQNNTVTGQTNNITHN
eukprot:XP_011667628.1 PREDICTED: uncharacterized protein LOC105439844 [Strongylocentrotus purpuratus]